MKILVVAATEKEIAPLLKKRGSLQSKPDVLVTGVGMVATAFHLARFFSAKKYDAAINLGICGSFDRNLHKGEVVVVKKDIFSELGVQDGEQFTGLHQLGLADKKDLFLSPVKKITLPFLKEFRAVKGITVNTVHGNDASIAQVNALYKPAVESMEGAAFFYACNRFKIPALQLRSVSNYVEKRNTADWNIPLAVKNLNEAGLQVLKSL